MRSARAAALALSLVSIAAAAPAASGTVATAADAREAAIGSVAARAGEVLAGYVRRDTSNPPGNEIEGARYLASVLAEAGIASRIFESAPGRGNLYARVAGDGSRRPLLLLSHIDVVPADPARWSAPPFAATVRDGVLYGRGALDCKGVGVVDALALIAARKAGIRLGRDVILLATADEEAGGDLGARWMLENHPELFEDVEFVLNEGGALRREEDGRVLFDLGVAEKGPCWMRVSATGEPGHGSRPADQTAVTRLIAALHSLDEWDRPIEVVPAVAGYYAAYSKVGGEHAAQYRHLARALREPRFRSWFLSDPGSAALVRDTLAPTVLSGGAETNVIPPEAHADIDARLLPGHSCAEFVEQARARVGGANVVVEPLKVAFAATASPLENEMVDAVRQLAAEEGEQSLVLPALLTGFTDSHWFRERGIASYGMVPVVVDDGERHSVHASDERVRVAELETGVHRMVRLLELAAGLAR